MASSSTPSSLPLDLIEQILLWTPADFLVRAKQTCKQWCDLINDERFIYKHLDHSPERLLRTDERRFLRTSETVQIMDLVTRRLSVSPMLDDFQPAASFSNIVSLFHCDGLMLCILSDKESHLLILALWNPLTAKFKRVEHRLPPQSATYNYFGFGYHTNTPQRDYKILRFSSRYFEFDEPVVEIYACNSKSWRTLVDDAEVVWYVYQESRGVPVMGNMYWLVRKEEEYTVNRYHVMCFDFSYETFKEICFCHLPYANNFLGCYDGDKLSILEQNILVLSPIEVWVSSKLADGNVSFVQYFTVDSPNLPALRCIFKEDPVYCIAENKRIIAWCAGQVYNEGGHRESTCITLYEIDEGGVSNQLETERHYSYEYFATFLCGYLYVPSLIPLPV